MDDQRRVIERWQEAEAKIYPLVMVDAHGYEEAVVAVGSVVDLLRRQALDLDMLLTLAAEPEEVASRAELGQLPGSLTAATVVDAACAIRHRELEADVIAERWLGAVRSARRAAERWADVHDPASALGLLGVPELRVDAATGIGVHTTLTVDPNTAEQVLLLTPVQLDLDHGLLSHIDAVEPRLVACDQSAWTSAADGVVNDALDQAREPSIYRQDTPH
jgi:hypothetical protein